MSNDLNFKIWMEDWRPPRRWNSPRTSDAEEQPDPKKGLPIVPFNIGFVTRSLAKHEVNNLYPRMKFTNEVHWGDGPGSMRMYIGTGLNVVMERMAIDKSGKNRWITKKVFQINQAGYGGFESAVVNEILDQVYDLYESRQDSFIEEYDGLESLTQKVYETVLRTAKPIFRGQGIKKVDDDTYIIRLLITGMGNGAAGGSKILENHTIMRYDRETGIIRMINTNIEASPGSTGQWDMMEADTDFKFLPTQPADEIAETLANTLHWY